MLSVDDLIGGIKRYNPRTNIDLIDKAIDSTYDLVIIGDCIEHMKKSEGIDLLNFLVYRSKYILIHYPNEYIQGTVDDHIHEAHISIWHESDFQAFDYKFIKNGFMHTYQDCIHFRCHHSQR